MPRTPKDWKELVSFKKFIEYCERALKSHLIVSMSFKEWKDLQNV